MMDYRTLDHADPSEAPRICSLLPASYATEAELIGASDFPVRRSELSMHAVAGDLRSGERR